MSVSLPPDKLANIQQLALSLQQNQHVTVHRIMSLLGKANFCTSGHSKLQHLCHVIQSDMLYVYHCIYSCSFFSFLLTSTGTVISFEQSPVPLQFPLPDVVLQLMPHPLIGPFIFRDLVYLYHLVDSLSSPLGPLGLNAFNHPWMFQVGYVFPCQRSTQIFDSGGIMLDGGFLVPHSSQHVGRHSSAVSNHKRSCCGCFIRLVAQGSAISDMAVQ